MYVCMHNKGKKETPHHHSRYAAPLHPCGQERTYRNVIPIRLVLPVREQRQCDALELESSLPLVAQRREGRPRNLALCELHADEMRTHGHCAMMIGALETKAHPPHRILERPKPRIVARAPVRTTQTAVFISAPLARVALVDMRVHVHKGRKTHASSSIDYERIPILCVLCTSLCRRRARTRARYSRDFAIRDAQIHEQEPVFVYFLSACTWRWTWRQQCLRYTYTAYHPFTRTFFPRSRWSSSSSSLLFHHRTATRFGHSLMAESDMRENSCNEESFETDATASVYIYIYMRVVELHICRYTCMCKEKRCCGAWWVFYHFGGEIMVPSFRICPHSTILAPVSEPTSFPALPFFKSASALMRITGFMPSTTSPKMV